MPYCDNLSVGSESQSKANDGRERVSAHHRSLGFRVHEETEAALHAASLGFALDGLQGRFSITPARAYKVREPLLYLSRRPRVSGAQLERVLGHATFLFWA